VGRLKSIGVLVVVASSSAGMSDQHFDRIAADPKLLNPPPPRLDYDGWTTHSRQQEEAAEQEEQATLAPRTPTM
jgi:hypothetical protein